MSSAPLDPCNVVVLIGRVARDPFSRTLASGEVSVEVDVTIPGPPSETVNVVVDDSAELALTAGTEVLVVGRVRRRFFRAGGSTQSRTEVVAAEVLAARRTKRSAHAVEEAAAALLQLVTPPGG